MVEDKKVSVIVPVYNVENFLKKCIQSICDQTYSNIEIILVDDGSKDGSGAICDEFAQSDSRVRVIHKDNNGVSAARNSGLDIAIGEYVCFVDGDDYVMPDYVEYMLKLAVNNAADIALTTSMFGNFDEKKSSSDTVRVWSSEDAVEAILCYKVPIGCYCKLFNRKKLGGAVRFIPEVFIGEGFNFNIDAFQNSKRIIAGCKKIYYYRRDNPTSAMTKFSAKKCECGLQALQIIRERLIIDTERVKKAWTFANWRTHSDFYDMIKLANAEKDHPELYKECRKITKTQYLVALSVPTSKQNKIRAVIMGICPSLIPVAMRIRRKLFIK